MRESRSAVLLALEEFPPSRGRRGKSAGKGRERRRISGYRLRRRDLFLPRALRHRSVIPFPRSGTLRVTVFQGFPSRNVIEAPLPARHGLERTAARHSIRLSSEISLRGRDSRRGIHLSPAPRYLLDRGGIFQIAIAKMIFRQRLRNDIFEIYTYVSIGKRLRGTNQQNGSR